MDWEPSKYTEMDWEPSKYTPNILESIRIGPRGRLNPQPWDLGAPALPTLPSGSAPCEHLYYFIVGV